MTLSSIAFAAVRTFLMTKCEGLNFAEALAAASFTTAMVTGVCLNWTWDPLKVESPSKQGLVDAEKGLAEEESSGTVLEPAASEKLVGLLFVQVAYLLANLFSSVACFPA